MTEVTNNDEMYGDGRTAAKMFEIELDGVLHVSKKRVEADLPGSSVEQEIVIEGVSIWLGFVRANPTHYLFRKLERLWNAYYAEDCEGNSLEDDDYGDLIHPAWAKLKPRIVLLNQMYGGPPDERGFELYLDDYISEIESEVKEMLKKTGVQINPDYYR